MKSEFNEKWHVNNEGYPDICQAEKRGCPFKDFEHQPTRELALEVYEESQRNLSYGREYNFPKYALGTAIASIEKANKKAERAGIDERFTYSINEYSITKPDDNGFLRTEDRVSLKLNTPSISHEGWTFVGKMEWDEESGLITKLAPGQTLNDRPETELCDVCKKVRHRNNTYIVSNGSEQRQVGSNCLQQFMGIRPAGLWMLDFEEEFKEKIDQDLPNHEGSRNARYSTEEILLYGLAISNERGWVSKGLAMQSGALSTSSILDTILSSGKKTTEQVELLDRTRIGATNESTKAQLKAVLESVKEMSGDSDFSVNLKKLVESETVSNKNIPLLLSAIGVHQAANRKKIEKKVLLNSEWQGTKGEKLPPREVTVTSVRQVPNYSGRYGAPDTSTVISFRDNDGNVYKSFYSGSRNMKEGEKIEITSATVKDHSEWQGAKETMITRIKVKSVRPEIYPPTELKKDSPFADTWTVDELTESSKKANSSLKSEMKKKAGKGQWDRIYDQPYDPDLIKEYAERREAISVDYETRYHELA